MFKPLLRTLPTLSGNFTIACKLREFDKENTNEYSTYVRLANMIPLQNFMSNKDIELNLLNGKYEHDIAKYYYYYSNVFYKNNFNYNKNNYAILDLDSIYNYNNDARNKDYEFGCKRIQYSQNGSQFNFYAPIYVDNINDLPEYFCINLEFNNHLTKKIKVYINKDNKRNYLKTYLTRYLKQIDERVIFCLPESLQATYFGIDVKNGGIIQYKDNLFGDLYVTQKTINNFDYTICQGFERNYMIMKQIIPLSFSFNINDLFNNYEKNFFEGVKIKIYGHYHTTNNLIYDMYDFDINYTNLYNKFNKYNSYSGKYNFNIGKDSNSNIINVMNVGFPSLNESKYIKYRYTNKITPIYCKFRMMLSDEDNPYITNINFAYSYNQYPNQKYGEFPTMFKGIFPQAIISNNDFKLPIGQSLEDYYKFENSPSNNLNINTSNIDKYIKLMSNYYSLWYNIYDYNPDFTDINFINKLFNNDLLWSNVKYNYTYYKGILYSLKKLEKYNIDKFGIFCGVNLNFVSEDEMNNDLIKANMILSSETINGNTIYNYNELYNMKLRSNKYNLSYYNKILDISLNNLSSSIVTLNCNMIKDIYGTYVEEKNFIEENTYYKVNDVIDLLSRTDLTNYQELLNEIKQLSIIGYELLEGLNNINYFNDDTDETGKTYKNFIFKKLIYESKNYNDNYYWLYDLLYYTNQLNTQKNKLSDNYELISYDEDLTGKFIMFVKYNFIHKNDIVNIFEQYNYKSDILISLFNKLKNKSYYYNISGNVNGIDIEKYFTKTETVYSDIYVDTYNLNNYIKLYNKQNNTNISYINKNNIVKKYAKIIDKNHLVEYLKELYKNENNYTSIDNVFDLIYIKERCWVIDLNKINIYDKYISFYDYIIDKVKELYTKHRKDQNQLDKIKSFVNIFLGLYNGKDNELSIKWIDEYLSDVRTNNNYFIIPIGNDYIELDICIYKEFVLLNNDLQNIINNGFFLYLYIPNKCLNENMSMWDVYSSQEAKKFSNIDSGDYITPLFNNVYYNSTDMNNIKQMIVTNKINDDNKYILSYSKYFKEINIDKSIKEILIKDYSFIDNFVNEVDKLKLLNNDELTIFEDDWNEYCTINGLDLEKAYLNYEIYIDVVIKFLKEKYDNIYRHIIKEKGIILYSKSNILDLNYNNITLTDNLIYDEENKIYIYSYNNHNYAFYYINIDIDNTNNSFNIMNDYNLNVRFESVNDININDEIFNNYFSKIFYLIEPFLKINIFNEFCKNINTIITYPHEMEIKIEYMGNILNESEKIKYKELLDNESTTLYSDLVKLSRSKKIKLLRYFNYITPNFIKTSVVKDLWELKFMNKNNVTKNTKKYNTLSKDNVNIYKYNGIKYYDGIYSTLYEDFVDSLATNNIVDPQILYQYEYKHFNDNLIFNLPESITVNDTKYYDSQELSNYKDNLEEIKEHKIYILNKYFNDKNLDYNDIILFLFNKYDSNMIIEPVKLKTTKNEKLYKISYTFNLI